MLFKKTAVLATVILAVGCDSPSSNSMGVSDENLSDGALDASDVIHQVAPLPPVHADEPYDELILFKRQEVLMRAESGSKTVFGYLIGPDSSSFLVVGTDVETTQGGCIRMLVDNALRQVETEFVFHSADVLTYYEGCNGGVEKHSQARIDSQGNYIGQSIKVAGKTWFSLVDSVLLLSAQQQISSSDGYSSVATEEWYSY